MEGRKAETDLGRHGMLEARGESRRHRRQPQVPVRSLTQIWKLSSLSVRPPGVWALKPTL